MVPSFCLRPRADLRAAYESACALPLTGGKWSATWEEKKRLHADFAAYRAPREVLDKVEETVRRFEGTRKYHNYTSSKSYDDPSARRYMKSFVRVGETVSDVDGMQWVSVSVTGQSFLLHQIRKMMSMSIDVVREAATEEDMEGSFGDGTMKLGVAPSQGLFLDMSFFDLYSNRDNVKDRLEWWKEGTPAHERWREFKEGVIVKHVLEEERREMNFLEVSRWAGKSPPSFDFDNLPFSNVPRLSHPIHRPSLRAHRSTCTTKSSFSGQTRRPTFFIRGGGTAIWGRRGLRRWRATIEKDKTILFLVTHFFF